MAELKVNGIQCSSFVIECMLLGIFGFFSSIFLHGENRFLQRIFVTKKPIGNIAFVHLCTDVLIKIRDI